ncbi:aminopeptidase [Elysia marginata]|uniref:Aminopeptidase n=1 Tax=Elysia marginata TaxID=1093978 RepID=A0AAV4F6Y1_9GAST|nr:aminopeptidase [Elysia marginata]
MDVYYTDTYKKQKATFELEIEADAKYVVLANTKEKSSSPGVDCSVCTRHSFHKTYVMSTYLVGFAIGEFEHITKNSTNGVQVSVWFPFGRREDARYGLDSGVKAVDLFENFFDVPMELSKLGFAPL